MSSNIFQLKNVPIKISKLELDSYKKMFKYIISKNIQKFSLNNKLKEILSSITEKEIYFSYYIFSNFYFRINSHYYYNDKDDLSYLFNISQDLQMNEKMIILWYLFIFNNTKINLENGKQKLVQMNQIRYLLNETNNIIFKLYLSGNLNEKQIFIFIDFYLFWIEYSTFYYINEKNRKIKNIYLFKYLFSLLNNITCEIMKNIDKDKLGILIDFMEKLKKNDEINKEYNIIILIKFNYIQSFVEKLLYNNDIHKIIKINDDFINILTKFCAHFFKFKYNLSNIFDKFLENTRIAYEHLYNFEDNIKKIVHDLNIQNFQTKLIKKILEAEEETLDSGVFPPMADFFYFNGLDSIIAFKMDKFEFEENFMFFSFNLNPDIIKSNNNLIYPLLTVQREIQRDSKNYIYENLLLFYFEKMNKKEKGEALYSLSFSQPLTKGGISMKKDDKLIIKKNVNYYCCIYFNKTNIQIFLYHDSVSQNSETKRKIMKLNNVPQSNIIFSFGCDSLIYSNKDPKEKDERKNFFSGYIGPVIMITNLSSKLRKNVSIEEIIEKILMLKEGYKNLLFFKGRKKGINNKNSNNNNNIYSFNGELIDYSLINQENIKWENSINSLLKKHFNSFECSLYLTPNCFTYFHNKIEINKQYHLPLVANLCNKHKNYIIKKIDVTLSSNNLSMPLFIYDNGFNYFCLQFEYFNQLIQYYLINKELNQDNFDDIFMNNDCSLINDIIFSIKLILLMLGNRGNEINLSKSYKQTFMTLFNLLKNLNKIKPIINQIIGNLISLSDIYKCNIFTNYYNLKDILIAQEDLKKEIELENFEIIQKQKKIVTQQKIQTLKDNYNDTIKKNCSFFVGIMEILLSQEFYTNNKKDTENYLLMKLTFEKVSSIMDIKDYECLSFLSYPNLFIQALSFTNPLQNLMVEYMPDIQISYYTSDNFYKNFGGKNYIKKGSEEDSNVLVSYFKLLNIFFRNKAINKNTSKDYFQKVFRFVLGNHRYDLPIVYNFLHMFYYFIAENYKFYINYDEIIQMIDYLNEITKLKEEDLFNLKNSINDINNSDLDKKIGEINEEEEEEEENEKNLKIDEKINNNENNLFFIKTKEKIKSAIICILIEILFSQEELQEPINNLINYISESKINKNTFTLIKDELDKYFNIILNNTEESKQIKKNIKDFSKYYLNMFNLLTALLHSLFSNNIDYNNYEEGEKKDISSKIFNAETQKILCVFSIINLLSDISNKIEGNINIGSFKIETIYCILNLLKFFYNIIMDNKLNILYTHDLFFTIVENVFNHCIKLSLNNSNIFISLEKENDGLKTIIELIFDIYFEYSINICVNYEKTNFFKNNKNRIQLFAIGKIQNYFIIENKNTKLKEIKKFNYTDYVSIFFINDYLRLISTNKKYIKSDFFNFDITQKNNDIKDLETYIKNQNKFEFLFMIFFLIKIGFYKREISIKLKNSNNIFGDNVIKKLNELNRKLIEMQKIIIDDYKKLYILSKDYCNRSISNYPSYNIIKNIVELKILNETKNALKDELFIQIINDLDSKMNILSKDEITIIKSGFSLSIIKKNKPGSKRGSRNFSVADFNQINNISHPLSEKNLNKIIEGPISVRDTLNQNELLSYNFEEKLVIENKNNRKQSVKSNRRESENIFNFVERDTKYINSVIPLSNIDNTICFFDQYDEMYLKNPKKELMNTIFSYYFQKSFFSDDNFKILKKIYLNKFKAESNTKLLNYPSKLKHFTNGMEPPMFFKSNKSFYISKVFPVTHDYFYNYMQDKKIISDSIILFQNKLKVPKLKNKKNDTNIFDYNCELISIDHSFYGHLIYSNENKYLIFEEKKFLLYDKEPSNTDDYFSDLFSICSITKKPNKYKKCNENKNQRNKINKIVERGINKKVIILYSEIEQIIERRFLLMWQSIEIYLKNGKSYFFNLLDSQKCQKVLEIFNNNKELSQKLVVRNDFEKHIKTIQQEWIKNRLDTYEYLLFINKYSSRSYNDSNQYLVFPWLLKKYTKLYEINKNEFEIVKFINQIEKYGLDEKEKEDIEKEENMFEEETESGISDGKGNTSGSHSNTSSSKKERNPKKPQKIKNEYFKYLREFKYPICAQTEKNKELCIKRYKEDCMFNFKYHSGTHYSTSAYVYFYLMRNEPFSTLLVKLQNYSQENPNRMFHTIQSTIETLDSGNDNRELLPEFFSKIEQFINFNCVFFGKEISQKLVDDAFVNKEEMPPLFNLLSNKINFIIEHRKLLNSESISMLIGDWIDNIFGINQLPDEEDRLLSCNIFSKSSYEQKTNLRNKLIKYRSPEYKKKVFTPQKIIQKLTDIINMIICFGQTPYQLFKEKHPRRRKEEIKPLKEKGEEKIKKENNPQRYPSENDFGEDYVMGDDDIQSLIINYIRPEKTNSNIEGQGLYFEINPSINKVFILSKKREISIFDSKLYDRKGENYYGITLEQKIEMPYMKFFKKISNDYISNYYILKQKYCFSSFIRKKNNNKSFYYYYNKYVNDLFESDKKEKSGNDNNEFCTYKFITCRYLDNSFKINIMELKENQKKKDKEKLIKDNYKIFSFVCQDFVSSCCAISEDEFLLGLKNGKLIKGKIIEVYNNEEKIDLNQIEIKVIYEKIIQAHKGSINAIEVDFRLGIIITCGDDNFIHIRKLYDFELLTPIKVKDKYIITLTKISPMNLLYAICLNKINNHSIIYGYSLSGFQFAKSEYGYYTNIDFTSTGNIVSLLNKIDIAILYGSNLKRIKVKENEPYYKEFMQTQKKLDGSLWMQYDYFTRKNTNTKCKVISYIAKNYTFNTINVDNIISFD